jgi:hypothetical protein
MTQNVTVYNPFSSIFSNTYRTESYEQDSFNMCLNFCLAIQQGRSRSRSRIKIFTLSQSRSRIKMMRLHNTVCQYFYGVQFASNTHLPYSLHLLHDAGRLQFFFLLSLEHTARIYSSDFFFISVTELFSLSTTAFHKAQLATFPCL